MNMLKRILIAALWLPLTALAQSYPSPMFNNVTVQGALTVSGGNAIGLGALAQQAANTVLANATGSTANITAFLMPSCSTSASALNWTSGTGFTCNTAVIASNVSGTVLAGNGGTGRTTLTSHGVLLGAGTAAISQTTAGTSGQALVSGGASADPAFGVAGVIGGGTGLSTITAHGVMLGEGTSNVATAAVGTTGQVLVGSTGADPAFGTTVSGLTFTSAITPQSTGGIVGTTTNDSANAGSVGEYFSSTNSVGVSLTSNTASNVTSISLTAGDWNVGGVVILSSGGGSSMTNCVGGISSTSSTVGGIGTYSQLATAGLGTSGVWATPTPTVRISLSATTTIYLIGYSGFSSGTVTATGNIWARRVR